MSYNLFYQKLNIFPPLKSLFKNDLAITITLSPDIYISMYYRKIFLRIKFSCLLMTGNENAEFPQVYKHLHLSPPVIWAYKHFVISGEEQRRFESSLQDFDYIYLVENHWKASCGFITPNKKHPHMNIKLHYS